MKKLFAYSNTIVKGVHNNNYSFSLNGERLLIEKISRGFDGNSEIVFDVGANIGQWQQEARFCFIHAQIFSFEPTYSSYSNLKLLDSDKSKSFNIALAETTKKITFYDYGGTNTRNSVFEWGDVDVQNVTEVDAISGDEFCASNNIAKILFLKIDAEGSESFILKGFKNMLKSNSIRIIQFERACASVGCWSIKEYLEFFEENNYVMGKLYPDGVEYINWTQTTEAEWSSNFVAVPRGQCEEGLLFGKWK